MAVRPRSARDRQAASAENTSRHDLQSLLEDVGNSPVGSVILTRAEGWSYEVMSGGTAQGGANGWHLTTAGGMLLRALPKSDGYDIRAFGAVCDGVADDTVPMRMMMETNEARLNIKGKVRITESITRAASTDLQGDGLQSSIIIMDNNAALTFNGGDGGDHYHMRNFIMEGISFRAGGVNPAHAVMIEYTGGSGGSSKSVDVRNCEFIGKNNTCGFGVGLALHNCRNYWLDNLRFHGARNGPVSGTGLRITGDVSDGAPVEMFIQGIQGFFLDRLVDISGWVEGVYISKTTAIGCHYGVVAVAAPSVASGSMPLLFVTESHFNVDTVGIDSTGFVQSTFGTNVIYGTFADGTRTDAFIGIKVTPPPIAMNTRIVNNDFQTISDFTQKTAVYIGGSSAEENVIVGSNTFGVYHIGVHLAPGTNRAVVRDDNSFIAVGTPVHDEGVGNFVAVGAYHSGGSRKTFGDGLQWRFGSSVITLNAGGDGTVQISPAVQGEVLYVAVSNGDATQHGDKQFVKHSATNTGINVRVIPNPGAVPVRVDWAVLAK